MTVDGRRQRRAVSAAEQALTALEVGDAAGARRAAREATELDQVGAFGEFARAVDRAAADLDAAGRVTERSWVQIVGSLDAGPLRSRVEAHRSGA